jgi:hypothetical protein
MLSEANTKYLNRPVFGGSTPGSVAYADATDGSGDIVFAGNKNQTARTVGANAQVRIEISGPEAFGEPGTDTELFGGMCWDEDARPLAGWITASIECGNAGGRLPSLSELIAYVAQPGTQVVVEHWSGDVAEFDGVGNEEIALARGEAGTSLKRAPVTLGYRCLFYRAN